MRSNLAQHGVKSFSDQSCGCQNQWYQFGVGESTTHFRTYFSGDWDVHWGYGILTHGLLGLRVSFLKAPKSRFLTLTPMFVYVRPCSKASCHPTIARCRCPFLAGEKACYPSAAEGNRTHLVGIRPPFDCRSATRTLILWTQTHT